jgi:anti-sigma factor RsiW
MFGMTNGSKSCEQNQEKISSFLDAELSAKEKRMLEKHLSVCVTCRTLEEWLRCIKEGISKSASNIVVSEVTRNKILGLLDQIPRETPSSPWWRRLLKRN